MWKCNECGCEFETPAEVNTTYERYCGVASLFGNGTPLQYFVCPCCHEEDIEEIYEEEE